MSKNQTEAGPTRPADAGRRVRRLNPRALILLALAVLLGVPALLGGRALQDSRRRAGLMREARQWTDDGRPDHALKFVNEYLRLRPQEPEALDFRAELLAQTARDARHFQEAAQASERVLRLDPDSPDRQQTRRRLVGLYLEMERFDHPENVPYQTAERVVRELIERAGPEGAEPEDHRLLGRVLEGRARRIEGDEAGAEPLLRAALVEYRKALQREPGDLQGAERLADLYRRLNEPEAAEAVLEGLIQAEDSARARLVLYRHHTRAGDLQRAREALEQAIAQEPKNLETRLTAAREALGRNDLAAARGHLNELVPADRETIQARVLAGAIDLQANALDNAVENWRQGLLQASGTDADLTWWLAYVLLQLGRIEEATPLIDQFYRLVGQEEPTPEHSLLTALKLQKAGRGAEAVAALEIVRLRIVEPLRPQANLVLGQCYEGQDVHDLSKALEAYRRAAQLAPGWSAPQLAIVRLLQESDPAEASRELNRALAANPDDPALLIALAERSWRTELEKPEANRSWNRTESLLDRAEAVAPHTARVALARADYLSATGRLDQAVDFLGDQIAAELDQSVEIWGAYAAGLARQGRLDEALVALQDASQPEAAGDHVSLRILRARLRTQQGQGRAARAELVAELDRLPETQRPQVWQALAELQLAQGDLKAAREALGRSVALAPDDPGPRLLLLDLALAEGDEAAIRTQVQTLQSGTFRGAGNLYGRVGRVHELLRVLRIEAGEIADDDPRVAEAEQLIAQILEQAPGLPAGHLLLGLLQEQLGNIDRAVDAYEEVVQRSRSRPAMNRLAALLLRRGQPEDIQRLGRLAAAVGEEVDMGRYLAQASALAGDRDRARRLANEVLEGNPESLQTHLWAARFLNTLDAPEEAANHLRNLIRRQPAEPGPRLALLAFQVERGEQDQALQTIEEIAEHVESDRLEFLLAQCYRLVGQTDRAAELFEAALRQWSEDPTVRRAAAEFFEAEGRTQEAEATVRGGLDDDGPQDPWAARKLALMLSARSGDIQAREEARRLIEPEGPLGNTSEDRIVRAVVLARSPEPADREKAIEALEALADDLPAADPLAANARRVLIELLLNTGRPEPAVRHAEALAAEPLRPDAATIALAAEVLLHAGRLDEVNRQVRRLVEIDPNDLRIPRLRARVLLARNDPDAAAKVIEAAANAREPDGEGAEAITELVRLLLGLKAPDAAERLARRIADAESARSWLLAEVLATLEKLPEAILALEIALDAGASATDLVPALERIIMTAAGADRLETAGPIVERVVRDRPEAPDPVRLLALIRHFQGRFEEEVKLYAQVDELGPTNYLHLNNWAWTLSEDLGRPEEALPRAEQALQRARPEDLGPVLDTKGVILTRLGHLDEAIRNLKDSTELRPAPLTYFHLARAYQKADRIEEAQAAVQQARQLGLDPDQLSEADRADWIALPPEGNQTDRN
ncbi:hypothetical protein BH23PLA1_BH23PLA1_04840 [soil metagenome]